MKQKMNEKGYGAYEFLTVAVVCLLMSAIILVAVLKNGDHERFFVFRYNAKIMALNVLDYTTSTREETIYLHEMIQNSLISPMKNPFLGDEHCDEYESKVQIEDEKRYVTLRCGNYLISNQEVTKEKYKIYLVDDWTEKKTDKTKDQKQVYNVKSNGKTLLEDYYEENLFISILKEKTGKNYKSMADIAKDYKVVSKTFYRSKKEITEIGNE